jgi:taurine dioxygenase
MSITISPYPKALGAEITGVRLSSSCDDELISAIKSALHEHLVLVFRDQSLEPGEQVAFSERFGKLVVRVSGEFLHPEYPPILILSNRIIDGKAEGATDAYAGSHWHSDLTYAQKPSFGSMLHAIEVAKEGGDTAWANMYAAYAALPEDIKMRIGNLKAIHIRDRRKNPRAGISDTFDRDVNEYYDIKVPDSLHPMVRTHPITGQKSLYVSPRFTVAIDGIDNIEGQRLLDELFEHQKKPEFIYQHKWEVGDLVFWDNSATIHLACGGLKPYDIRKLHRTSIAGSIPY